MCIMGSKRMRESLDIGQAFLNREEIPGVLFMHNDYVRVVSGEPTGSFGSLVTVLGLEPEPLFVLGLETGFDVEVRQSQIQLIERWREARFRPVADLWPI